MTRFFVRPDQIVDGAVHLDSDDAHHLNRVLRAKIGDEIQAFDSSGKRYVAAITKLAKSQSVAEITSTDTPDTEPNVHIIVVQSLPKTTDKLEWVLQHGVEVGVSEFWIFRSKRSEAGKLAEKPERWAKIVKTAAEQSGRTKLPQIRILGSLSEVISNSAHIDLKLLCDEAEKYDSLHDVLKGTAIENCLVLIGPEGGWAQEEREVAIASGYQSITLGKRILRTETAALVVSSQLLYALNADY